MSGIIRILYIIKNSITFSLIPDNYIKHKGTKLCFTFITSQQEDNGVAQKI